MFFFLTVIDEAYLCNIRSYLSEFNFLVGKDTIN